MYGHQTCDSVNLYLWNHHWLNQYTHKSLLNKKITLKTLLNTKMFKTSIIVLKSEHSQILYAQ